jgi:hypothetical protein
VRQDGEHKLVLSRFPFSRARTLQALPAAPHMREHPELSAQLITSNITLTGNGFMLDAANLGRAIFVASGTVNVSNLTIANALARGGDGDIAGGGNAYAGTGGIRISW